MSAVSDGFDRTPGLAQVHAIVTRQHPEAQLDGLRPAFRMDPNPSPTGRVEMLPKGDIRAPQNRNKPAATRHPRRHAATWAPNRPSRSWRAPAIPRPAWPGSAARWSTPRRSDGPVLREPTIRPGTALPAQARRTRGPDSPRPRASRAARQPVRGRRADRADAALSDGADRQGESSFLAADLGRRPMGHVQAYAAGCVVRAFLKMETRWTRPPLRPGLYPAERPFAIVRSLIPFVSVGSMR